MCYCIAADLHVACMICNALSHCVVLPDSRKQAGLVTWVVYICLPLEVSNWFALSRNSLQHLQADTSHYTECTALPTSEELRQSTPPEFPQSRPPRIVVDDVGLQQKGDVNKQPISHLSGRQSDSGEYCMLQKYTIFLYLSLHCKSHHLKENSPHTVVIANNTPY